MECANNTMDPSRDTLPSAVTHPVDHQLQQQQLQPEEHPVPTNPSLESKNTTTANTNTTNTTTTTTTQRHFLTHALFAEDQPTAMMTHTTSPVDALLPIFEEQQKQLQACGKKSDDGLFPIHNNNNKNNNNSDTTTIVDVNKNCNVSPIVELSMKTSKSYDREWRRKRRRRLCQLLVRTKGSFTALLNANYDIDPDNDNDDAEENRHEDYEDVLVQEEEDNPDDEIQILKVEQLPKRIRIDVDAEIGLKADTLPAVFIKQEPSDTMYRQVMPDGTLSSMEENYYTNATNSITTTNNHTNKSNNSNNNIRGIVTANNITLHNTVDDEGWYDGVVAVALPEDKQYLNTMQQWVRSNLEFFSTTEDHLHGSFGGRHRKSKCKVGVRCIHCASAAMAQTNDLTVSATSNIVPSTPVSSTWNTNNNNNKKNRFTWPAGAVAYPSNLANIHVTLSQKSIHLESCPHMPETVRQQYLAIKEGYGDPHARGSRIKTGGISAVQYTLIAAKCRGIVDATQSDGIRFSRNVLLDPLPFQTVSVQVKNEAMAGTIVPSTTMNLSTSPYMEMDRALDNTGEDSRIAADPESESVLANAIANEDDYPTQHVLSQSTDKQFVTDFVFLVVRQMSICWCNSADLSKNYKYKVPGFAGWCCKWCRAYRSFPNMPESLKTPVAVSFANHLQKCMHVPSSIQKALLAYKKLHTRQILTMPFGSQKQLYEQLFARLRASDRLVAGDSVPDEPAPAILQSSSSSIRIETTPSTTPRPMIQERENEEVMVEVEQEEGERPKYLPECDDLETKEILANALKDWDPSENDNLILPSDRHLVTDYLFLTMRQLRMTRAESGRDRRRLCFAVPGLACMHCIDKGDVVSPSGRSFASAPDNFSASLNSSLYNHMQNCLSVPNDLKRALAYTRKMHTPQCASLKFGSQRKFFNRLFQRLQQAHIPIDRTEEEKNTKEKVADTQNGSIMTYPTRRTNNAPTTRGTTLSTVTLQDYGFSQISNHSTNTMNYIYCQRCSMVPMVFRACGSVWFTPQLASTSTTTPLSQQLQQHQKKCQGTFLDFTILKDALLQTIINQELSWDTLTSKTFRKLISVTVGEDETLTQVCCDHVLQSILHDRKSDGINSGIAIGSIPSETTTSVRVLDPVNCQTIRFPPSQNVDWIHVETVLETIPLLSTQTFSTEFSALLQYLQLISPSLVVSTTTTTIKENDTTSNLTKDTVDDSTVNGLVEVRPMNTIVQHENNENRMEEGEKNNHNHNEAAAAADDDDDDDDDDNNNNNETDEDEENWNTDEEKGVVGINNTDDVEVIDVDNDEEEDEVEVI